MKTKIAVIAVNPNCERRESKLRGFLSRELRLYDMQMIRFHSDDISDMIEEKITEIRHDLNDLDKEKVVKIAKEKSDEIKAKCQDLVDLAIDKGTPVLQNAAIEVRDKTIDVMRDMIKKLESTKEDAKKEEKKEENKKREEKNK